MAVPGLSDVYVLGCFERRVTIYSQQVRALNLIYALHKAKSNFGPSTRVAVIGGGVAGLTVAAAAAYRRCRVHLLERKPQLLHLLEGNYTRWVHPHIYDWPFPGAENPWADLPILDWRAASAGEVAD